MYMESFGDKRVAAERKIIKEALENLLSAQLERKKRKEQNMKLIIDVPDDTYMLTVSTVSDNGFNITTEDKRYNSIYINNHKLSKLKNIPHVDEEWITNHYPLRKPVYAGYNMCLRKLMNM